MTDLLTHNLDQLGVTIPAVLDGDPPAAMLAALAERTGVEPGRLRAMTLAGQVPWLMDTLYPQLVDTQEQFDTYVRANSVLLAPGEAGLHQVHHFKTWRGVWLSGAALLRACPVCAPDPSRPRSWVWQLPLVISCHEHGCRLGDESDINTAIALGDPIPPVAVDDPLATLDRYTYQALIAGRVELPGRSVHVAVWFRLLRSLLDEVSLALSSLSKTGRTTMERIWRTTGRPPRAGLTVWRPYEQMTWAMQEAMLHAVATALHLAADRQITIRGQLGSAIQPLPHQRVYDGDDPRRRRQATESATAIDAWLDKARVDPEPARQFLRLLTAFDPSPANAAEQRHFLITQTGIPPEFLRLDLFHRSGRTAVETAALLGREGFDPHEVRHVIGAYLAETPPSQPLCPDGDTDLSEQWLTDADLQQLRVGLNQ